MGTKLRRTTRATLQMRLHIAGMPNIELAVEEGVKQDFGFRRKSCRQSFLCNPCFSQHGPRTREPRHYGANGYTYDISDLTI